MHASQMWLMGGGDGAMVMLLRYCQFGNSRPDAFAPCCASTLHQDEVMHDNAHRFSFPAAPA